MDSRFRNERNPHIIRKSKMENPIKEKKIIDKVAENIDKKGEQAQNDLVLSKDLTHNLEMIKNVFKDCYDLLFRELTINNGKTKCFIAYIDGSVNHDEINENILTEFMKIQIPPQDDSNSIGLIDYIKNTNIPITNAVELKKVADIAQKLLNGFCVILVDEVVCALALSVPGWEERKNGEALVEPILRGSPVSFVESIKINTSLIRRKIKTPELKFEMFEVGKLSKTKIVMTYINGIVDQEIVNCLRDRIEHVDVDVVIESGQLEHYIEDNKFSLFPIIDHTERPDASAIALSEGRVVILVDGTPVVLIAPTVFAHFFISVEDNFVPNLFSPLIVLIRYLAFFFAMLFPSIFIAATTFHQEMIPFQLLTTLMASRANLPFPVFIEALLMEITFELLREAGERLPRALGQSLSIVGGLVIGQAAIQAGIVSPAMVVIIATTATASFVIPKVNMTRAVRILKLPFMISAATLGMFGIVMVGLTLMVFMVSLRSAGVPYMTPFASSNKGDWGNLFFKLPTWFANKRPTSIQKNNITRAKDHIDTKMR